MLYRLFTENVNTAKTAKLVGEYFPGFTIIQAVGFWNGQPENSLIIEIDSEHALEVCILAERIRRQNNQETVLVQQIEAHSVLV